MVTEVKLINQSGDVIKKWFNVNSSTSLDISNVAAGIYILKMITGGEVQSQKIIKE